MWIMENAVNISFNSPYVSSFPFFFKHAVERVATTIRVHEGRESPYPQNAAALKTNTAPLPHPPSICCPAFQNAENYNERAQCFRCPLSCAKLRVYTDGFRSWVIHFIRGDIFQHLASDMSHAVVHYISISLASQGQTEGGMIMKPATCHVKYPQRHSTFSFVGQTNKFYCASILVVNKFVNR